MKERPILFNAPMIRAILANTKTQMRRIFKPDRMTWDANGRYTTYAMRGGELSTTGSGPFKPSSWLHYCPYGQPGEDRLYVRETFGHFERNENFAPGCEVFYRADGESLALEPWRPSIHMPRWASRITLEVTGVRVETLGVISHEDALAEGVSSIEEYKALWININGAWLPETWVWVLDLKRLP